MKAAAQPITLLLLASFGMSITATAYGEGHPRATIEQVNFHNTLPETGLEPPSIEPRLEPQLVKAAEFRRYLKSRRLVLQSSSALILDQREGVVLYEKNVDRQAPIASLTKLMTAITILDADLPLDEPVKIASADKDRLRGSRSRLRVGAAFTRGDLLHLALAASENRAAAALARTYPGGAKAFVALMNEKARQFGLKKTYFVDSTGLHSQNVSTAADLAKLVNIAYQYPLIRELTTTPGDAVVDLASGRPVKFMNTNRLVRRDQWTIGLSKTGYISDSGYCLVMQTAIAGRPIIMVLLNSKGKYTKFGDSNRIRKWLIETDNHIQRLTKNIASTQS